MLWYSTISCTTKMKTYCELDTNYDLSKIGERFDHFENFNLHVILKDEDFTIKGIKIISPISNFSHLNF